MDGQIKSKSNYISGKRDGLYEAWNEDGQVTLRRVYEMNVLVRDLLIE